MDWEGVILKEASVAYFEVLSWHDWKTATCKTKKQTEE
jgi:hypothetical protein